jgi:probable rRNA maturation factor
MKVKALKRLTVEAFQRHTASTFQPFNAPTIAVTNRQRTRKIHLRLLKQIADALLADLGNESAELGIHLVGTREMIRLNSKFLQHQGSTDVITFDYSDCGRAGCPQPAARPGAMRTSRPTLHGEIFICVDEAVRAARRFRTTWQSEIVRYLVHGVLHLRGHDDSHPGVRRKMKREEGRRLRALSRRFSLAQLAGAAKLRA